jgi:hypothetical protein
MSEMGKTYCFMYKTNFVKNLFYKKEGNIRSAAKH